MNQQEIVYSRLSIAPATIEQLTNLTTIPRESIRRCLHLMKKKDLVYKQLDGAYAIWKP